MSEETRFIHKFIQLVITLFLGSLMIYTVLVGASTLALSAKVSDYDLKMGLNLYPISHETRVLSQKLKQYNDTSYSFSNFIERKLLVDLHEITTFVGDNRRKLMKSGTQRLLLLSQIEASGSIATQQAMALAREDGDISLHDYDQVVASWRSDYVSGKTNLAFNSSHLFDAMAKLDR